MSKRCFVSEQLEDVLNRLSALSCTSHFALETGLAISDSGKTKKKGSVHRRQAEEQTRESVRVRCSRPGAAGTFKNFIRDYFFLFW